MKTPIHKAIISASEHAEINRMKDKYDNPGKYARSSVSHLMNDNTGKYDAKSTPQHRALKKAESPRAKEIRENNESASKGNAHLRGKSTSSPSSPFGAGPNKSAHPKGWYDKN